jgi:hypothetical protein
MVEVQLYSCLKKDTWRRDGALGMLNRLTNAMQKLSKEQKKDLEALWSTVRTQTVCLLLY